jgi:hypothetical protein
MGHCKAAFNRFQLPRARVYYMFRYRPMGCCVPDNILTISAPHVSKQGGKTVLITPLKGRASA